MSNKEQIKIRMAEILNQPIEALDDEVILTSLVNNSFILVELIIELQEEYDVLFGQEDMKGVSNVGQLIALFAHADR